MHRYSPALLVILILAACLPTQTLQKPGSSTLRAKRALNEVLQPSEAELSKRITPVVRAVRATADSVFSVLILGGASRLGDGTSVVGQGSGVIIDETGLALTNWHVIVHAKGRVVQARLKSGKTYTAKVLSTSSEYDLALLQLQVGDDKVRPVTMGDSDSLMIGESMIAIGNPRGHQNTVTVGVLSAENRSITVRAPDGRVRQYKGLLQTDAAINKGNSGGALLDITGKLIGINNAMAENSENIGFAIPVNTVRRVFHEVLLSSENLTSVYLGMQVREERGRVVLAKVAQRGPAYRAGLRDGDELVQINSKKVASAIDYARSLLGVAAERPLSVTVRRQGRQRTHRPVPLSNAGWAVVRRIGVEFEVIPYRSDERLVQKATWELYRELRERPRAYLRAVLRVKRVHGGTPGATLDLKTGDVILGIIDRVPEYFGVRKVINTFDDVKELNNALHVMSHRSRDPEYTVWILRDGEFMHGQLEIPRI